MGWIQEKSGWLPYWDDRFRKPLDHLPYWDDRRTGSDGEDEAQRHSPFILEGDHYEEREEPSIFEQAEGKMREDERRWTPRTRSQSAVDWVMPPAWDKETSADEPVIEDCWDASASVDSSGFRGVPWEYFDPEDPEFTQKVASWLTEFMEAGLITLKELDDYLSEAYVTSRIPSRAWLQRRKIRRDAQARRQRFEQELRRLRAKVGPMKKINWRLSEDTRTAVALEDATLWELAEGLTGSGANWRQFGYRGDPEKMSVGTRIDVSRWVRPLAEDVRKYVQDFESYLQDIASILRNGDEEAVRSLPVLVLEVAEKGSNTVAFGCAVLSVERAAQLTRVPRGVLKYVAAVGLYTTLLGMSFDFRALTDAIRERRPLDTIQRSSGLLGGGLSLLFEGFKRAGTGWLGKYGGLLLAIATFAAATGSAAIERHARRGFKRAQIEANREYVRALAMKVEKTAADLRDRERRVLRAIKILASFH